MKYASTWYTKNRDKKCAYNKARRQTPHGRYLDYIQEAKNRKKQFLITETQFFEITQKPCMYCHTIEKIGIDRKDSEIGYIYTNCVPCCSICNYMKRQLSIEQFINHCKIIASLN